MFFNHVFSLNAFKMPPHGELVVSCRFGAGGQSHPPAVGLEVGDLGRAGSDAATARASASELVVYKSVADV